MKGSHGCSQVWLGVIGSSLGILVEWGVSDWEGQPVLKSGNLASGANNGSWHYGQISSLQGFDLSLEGPAVQYDA